MLPLPNASLYMSIINHCGWEHPSTKCCAQSILLCFLVLPPIPLHFMTHNTTKRNETLTIQHVSVHSLQSCTSPCGPGTEFLAMRPIIFRSGRTKALQCDVIWYSGTLCNVAQQSWPLLSRFGSARYMEAHKTPWSCRCLDLVIGGSI